MTQVLTHPIPTVTAELGAAGPDLEGNSSAPPEWLRFVTTALQLVDTALNSREPPRDGDSAHHKCKPATNEALSDAIDKLSLIHI